jgi:hypothetical protein
MLFACSVPRLVPALPPVVPVPPPVPDKDGGGGTTAGGPRRGAADAVRLLPETPVEGGATTLDANDVAAPLRLPVGLPDVATEGGATTFGVRVVLAPLRVPDEFTVGGGATTSVGPKILPMMLLMNDPLPDGVGGGGTTVFDGSGTLPFESRCRSCETSVEGGGAITAGAGRDTLALRELARSGADTGGGTTAISVILTGALDNWRVTEPGAGGITLAASVGALRDLSATSGAGATTALASEGAALEFSRETFFAGAITTGSRRGATSA